MNNGANQMTKRYQIEEKGWGVFGVYDHFLKKTVKEFDTEDGAKYNLLLSKEACEDYNAGKEMEDEE
jgi:hypothetical protein